MSATDNWNVIVRVYGKKKKKNYYARRGSKHGCDRLRRRRRRCSRVRCRKHTSGTSAGGARRFRYWRAMMFRHAPSWPPPPKNRIFRSHAKKSETCVRACARVALPPVARHPPTAPARSPDGGRSQIRRASLTFSRPITGLFNHPLHCPPPTQPTRSTGSGVACTRPAPYTFAVGVVKSWPAERGVGGGSKDSVSFVPAFNQMAMNYIPRKITPLVTHFFGQ